MDISALKLSDRKEKQLVKAGLTTIEKLLDVYPRSYEDHRIVSTISGLHQYIGRAVSVVGRLENIHTDYVKKYIRATLSDDTDGKLTIFWFSQTYLAERFSALKGDVLIFGTITYNEKYKDYEITSPKYFSEMPDIDRNSIIPVYPKITGMSDEFFRSCIAKAFEIVSKDKAIIKDNIDAAMRKSLGIDDKLTFYRETHFPNDDADIAKSLKRIKAQTLIPFSFGMSQRKFCLPEDGVCFKTDNCKADALIKKIKERLPYYLTKDQEFAVTSITSRIAAGKRIDILLQGDVGCGKTVVAQLVAAAYVASGFQVAVMAPTTVLAEQHYHDFELVFAPLGYTVLLMSAGTNKRETEKIKKSIAGGTCNIVVGTSAVCGADVQYQNLGLTVVDEEHRFGVAQREKLFEKAKTGVGNISMSATPIPRSLAITMYGGKTEIINIRTMPNGRKPVLTILYSSEQKTWDAMHRQIKAGHQCYVVCPAITASNADAMKGVRSVEETEKKMCEYFKYKPDVKIVTLTGKMKAPAIEAALNAFKAGDANILLASTIVEVGVNVPNATVMVIQNAERFGLAQLHQLRGRVGRSNIQSYCVLLCNDKSNPRLQIMENTNDGYKIAQADLEQRGTGNLLGYEQNGFQKYIEIMLANPMMYKTINSEFEAVFASEQRLNYYTALYGAG